jgi:hypothetical protein
MSLLLLISIFFVFKYLPSLAYEADDRKGITQVCAQFSFNICFLENISRKCELISYSFYEKCTNIGNKSIKMVRIWLPIIYFNFYVHYYAHGTFNTEKK